MIKSFISSLFKRVVHHDLTKQGKKARRRKHSRKRGPYRNWWKRNAFKLLFKGLELSYLILKIVDVAISLLKK